MRRKTDNLPLIRTIVALPNLGATADGATLILRCPAGASKDGGCGLCSDDAPFHPFVPICLNPLQIRVRPTLFPDSSARPMAADEADIITQR